MGGGDKGGATSVGTPLAVHAHSATGPQHQGGATPTMGMDGSPHGGTPAKESHARSIGYDTQVNASPAASAAKFWKRDISSASEREFPFLFGHLFGLSTCARSSGGGAKKQRANEED